MTVEPLILDAPSVRPRAPQSGGFLSALDAAAAVFERADRTEAAFVAQRGGLQEMVVARAHADVALAIATAAASRAAQALAQIFGMQI